MTVTDVLSFGVASPGEVVVNSCTQWGKLEEIIVAQLPEDACFPPNGIDFHGECNNKYIRDTLPWPAGRKHTETIKRANAQYNQFAALLEGEGVTVRRPTPAAQDKPTVTPNWTCVNQYNCCPRDKLIVIGNELIEASMSQRARFFEEYCYRDLIQEYYKRDPAMIWTVAPKPQMKNNLYRDFVDRQAGRQPYWDLPLEQRFEKMHDYEFSTTEAEPVWDAADCTRLGKDVFVQHSKTTNKFGFEWLRRHLAGRGVTAHMLHFPYDIFPSHIDCTFVPLRPGLVLTNYERPVCESEVSKFREGGWKFVDAPKPCELNFPMPDWCQSSHWLEMNILSLGPNKVVIEEEEKALYTLLHDDLGFDVLTTPFRDCYEFGGSLHCATCDIRRDDAMQDFFAQDYN